MAMLADRITARISEIDSQITFAQDKARGEISRLQSQKVVLQQALTILTPEVEAAAAALARLGLINL